MFLGFLGTCQQGNSGLMCCWSDTMFYINGNGNPIVRKLQMVVLKETEKHWYEGKWYVLGYTAQHLKIRIQSYACSLSFLFLSCTLSWLYISIQFLFWSVF